MKYLLTGGTGFIGVGLAERLRRDGHAVRCLVRTTSNRADLAALGVEFADGDVTDAKSVAAAVDGVEAVIHVAGVVKALDPDGYYRVNEGGTRHVAAACADAGARRLVYVSSLCAAGPAVPGRPRREEDIPSPINHYGKSKLAAEAAVREVAGKVACAIVRPPTVYGPRDLEFSGLTLRTAKMGLYPILGLRRRVYTIVYVDDLVDLIVRVAQKGKSLGAGSDGVYYAGDGREYTHADFARLAGEAVGRRPLTVPLPVQTSLLGIVWGTAAMKLTGRPDIKNFDKYHDLKALAWTCAIDRAQGELGFAPTVLGAEGFRRAAAWFRERRLL